MPHVDNHAARLRVPAAQLPCLSSAVVSSIQIIGKLAGSGRPSEGLETGHYSVESVLREPLGGYTPLGWVGLIGLGLVVQFLAWLIINRGMGQVSVALGTLGLSVQQIATPFLAAWLLGEELKLLGLFGGLLITCGIVLVATGESRWNAHSGSTRLGESKGQ
jgi:hypothetical protein